MIKFRILVALGATILADCTSVIEGTEQVKVDTQPGGADCALERRCKVIAEIGGTPGFTTINNSRYDITVRCKKPGYKEATYRSYSALPGTTSPIIVHGKGLEHAKKSASDVGYNEDTLYNVVVRLLLVPIGTPTAGTCPPAPAQTPISITPLTK